MAETVDQPEPARSERSRPGPEDLYGVKDLTEDTAQKLVRAIEGSHPVRAIRGSQIATAVVGTLGFALFLVGIGTPPPTSRLSRTAGAPWPSASSSLPWQASSSAGLWSRRSLD